MVRDTRTASPATTNTPTRPNQPERLNGRWGQRIAEPGADTRRLVRRALLFAPAGRRSPPAAPAVRARSTLPSAGTCRSYALRRFGVDGLCLRRLLLSHDLLLGLRLGLEHRDRHRD